jgi:hypothetical protein
MSADPRTSRRLAGLIGPSVVVLTVTETLNFHIWATSIPAVVYLNGLIAFVAGLALVRAHNRWTLGWPVLVTLSGWLLVGLGLFRTIAPEARQGGRDVPSFALIALLFLSGAVLTVKGYQRDPSSVAG